MREGNCDGEELGFVKEPTTHVVHGNLMEKSRLQEEKGIRCKKREPQSSAVLHKVHKQADSAHFY